MTTLHLGVLDVPYVNAPSGTKGKSAAGEKTTGDIAEILEAKYGIFQTFVEIHGDDVAKALEDSVAGALESVLMGAPPRNDLHGAGTSKIETMFKDFLSKQEMDGRGVAGVPTQAALKGVNHRLKRKRGAPRPSFIDTGLYQSSMRAWVD